MVLGARAKTCILKALFRLKKGFGASAGPGPDTGCETILKALFGVRKVFHGRFRGKFWARPRIGPENLS